MLQKKEHLFSTFLSFLQNHTICTSTMSESYFDAYRDVMNPFYKDPNGKICMYTEMKRRSVYHEPFYSNEDKRHVGEEGRKYMMPSDRIWNKASKTLTSLDRVAVQVMIISINKNN